MNLNDITVGISQALYEEFGEDYAVYDNNVEQDLKEPCFLILPINPARELVVGNRYEGKNPYDIHYFPKKHNDRSELNDVLDRLYSALEYITVSDSKFRGTSMNGKIVDGMLHFFVDYNMFLFKKQPEVTKMGGITVKVEKKGD